MKHLGDITKLRGDEIPVVDIITGGSPCQDLSVAGLRKGIKHEDNGEDETTRSGLFMDQIRIVKEMRQNDRDNGRNGVDVRPRYMVWENVPGAFSSNGGKDFQTVLTEIVRVAQPDAPDVPMPDRGGWQKSGCLYGELGDWSVAYRVHDAQYWGVPQRRKRLCVLADFNGLSAPEILFDPELRGDVPDSQPHEAVRDSGTERGREVQPLPESLSGDSEPGGEAGQGASEGPAGRSDGAISIQGNTIDRTPKQNGGGYLAEHRPHAERYGPARRGLCCGLPERDGKPFCERDSASEGTGDEHQFQQRCESPEQVPPAKFFQNTGMGWWNEGDIAETVRTPCGGDSVKANIVLPPPSNRDRHSERKIDGGHCEHADGEHRAERQSCGAIGLDHVLISGGTTFQGRGWYDEVSGCLKTLPHGVKT